MQRLAAVPASASPYGANGGQPRGVRSDGGRLVSWAQLNSTPPPRDGTARCADTQCLYFVHLHATIDTYLDCDSSARGDLILSLLFGRG
jgi:hypothetical protein